MSTAAKNKSTLSREQASAIYDDLQRTMTSLMKKHQGSLPPPPSGKKPSVKPSSAKAPVPPVDENPAFPVVLPTKPNRGHLTALGLVGFFALAKVTFSILEASGVLTVASAQAALSKPAVSQSAAASTVRSGGPFSREEVAVLTALDHRRVELEERSQRLDERESELERRDREFISRQTQLKELTDQLRADRDKNEKKRNTQIEQLANVYGSMNPPEAAALIGQLDVQIALDLLERMPEKRIGQILSLMSPERALTITRMLSGKVERKS